MLHPETIRHAIRSAWIEWPLDLECVMSSRTCRQRNIGRGCRAAKPHPRRSTASTRARPRRRTASARRAGRPPSTEQPAARRQPSQRRRDQRQQQSPQRAAAKPSSSTSARSFSRVLARDAVAHLAHDEVGLRVRRLQRPHLAEVPEPRRRSDRVRASRSASMARQ